MISYPLGLSLLHFMMPKLPFLVAYCLLALTLLIHGEVICGMQSALLC